MSKDPNDAGSSKAVDEVVAAALKEVKQWQAPASRATGKFVYNTYDVEVIKGNQHSPSGWLHSPAHLELMRAAVRRLVKVSELRGDAERNVTHVRAARMKGTKKIYIWPVSKDDPEAIPVTGSGTSRFINLVTLLAPQNMLVESGFRERFAIEFTGEESPAGPALMMNLERPVDRRLEERKSTKKNDTTTGSEAGKAGSTNA